MTKHQTTRIPFKRTTHTGQKATQRSSVNPVITPPLLGTGLSPDQQLLQQQLLTPGADVSGTDMYAGLDGTVLPGSGSPPRVIGGTSGYYPAAAAPLRTSGLGGLFGGGHSSRVTYPGSTTVTSGGSYPLAGGSYPMAAGSSSVGYPLSTGSASYPLPTAGYLPTAQGTYIPSSAGSRSVTPTSYGGGATVSLVDDGVAGNPGYAGSGFSTYNPVTAGGGLSVASLESGGYPSHPRAPPVTMGTLQPPTAGVGGGFASLFKRSGLFGRRLNQYIQGQQPGYNLAPGISERAPLLPTANVAGNPLGKLLMGMGAGAQGALTSYGAALTTGFGGGQAAMGAAQMGGAAAGGGLAGLFGGTGGSAAALGSRILGSGGVDPATRALGNGVIVDSVTGKVQAIPSAGLGMNLEMGKHGGGGVASYSAGPLPGAAGVFTGGDAGGLDFASDLETPPLAEDPSPLRSKQPSGTFVQGSGEAGLNKGFYWTGGYWGYCPPPPTIAQSPPPPPSSKALQAIIKDPKQNAAISTGPTGIANIVMDGSPSVAGTGRRIISWAWVVKLEPDKTTAATGTGPVVQKALGPGQYTITLQVCAFKIAFACLVCIVCVVCIVCGFAGCAGGAEGTEGWADQAAGVLAVLLLPFVSGSLTAAACFPGPLGVAAAVCIALIVF